MQRVTITTIEAIAPYQGPSVVQGIRLRAVRQKLAVSAWGMNVLEFDPGCASGPDHVKDGQEDVYIVLEGSIDREYGDEQRTLSRGTLALVPPHVRRRFITGAACATLLALGGTLGQAYPQD
ncbi:MAG: cupin domain-containing protein [Polyangiaceae bacterium]